MNKKIEFNLKNIFIVGFSIITISVIGSYLSTSYALTENGYAVDSSNVEYKDNSSLGVTNVQAAIDGTCTKFNEQLNELRESMYPVGSIYLSTSLSTTTAVATALGGTWEVYGSGRTLIGSDGSSYKAGATGGATSVSTTLTTSNLPAHTHTVTAKGSVSSNFTGSSVTTGNNSTTPSATFTGTKGKTDSDGTHNHTITYAHGFSNGAVGTDLPMLNVYGDKTVPTGSSGAHTHSYTPSGSVALSNTTHTHSVTAKGTVSSTFTGSSATTSSTGSGTAFTTSTMQPYIVVYMYRRIS